MPTLKRTQMYFPDDMLGELKKRAAREHTTVSKVVRDAVSGHLKGEKAKDWADDPLWDIVGTSRSKDGDLSASHDKHLYGKRK